MTPEQQRALAMARARQRQAQSQAPQPNPDGTYGQPPEGMFVNLETGQMTSRELLRGNAPVSRPRAAGAGYLQGFSLGSADEMAGIAGRIEGGPEMGNFRREQARAMMEANQQAHPVPSLAGGVTGAVVSPVTRALPNATSVRGAAGTGAAIGSVEGFASGEGNVAERVKEGALGAGTGLFFGGLTSAVGKGVRAGTRRAFQNAEKRPSIETLRTAKNEAYKAVRESGEMFSGQEMTGLSNAAKRIAQDADFDDIADPQTAAVLRTLSAREGQPVSIDRLDRLRQTLWDRYNRGNEPMILDMIGEVDGLIASKGATSEVMDAARQANSKYAKAQLLENAFRKARLQTAATGSGGNILNKYRQAVVSIITKPHEAKWFSPEELAIMEKFVEGNNIENTMRRVGKLTPGGNGLMTALNVYAATVDPAMLTITAAATGAKGFADKTAMEGSEELLKAISTGIIAPGQSPAPQRGIAAGAAYGGNQFLD